MPTPAIKDKLETYLKLRAWDYKYDEADNTYMFWYTGYNAEWGCAARIRDKQRQLVIYSILPVDTPPERRPAMLEWMARANFGLIVGNFEFDLDSGSLRYKTSIDFGEHPPAVRLIKQLFAANLLTTDKYIPSIQSVFEGMSPIAALSQVE